MNQLIMQRNNAKVGAINFPNGYYMRPFQKGDELAWCECCAEVNIEEVSEEAFNKKMLEDETVNPDNIYFLISPTNEIIGTVTYQYAPEEDTGLIHMVGIKKEHQGKGLALPMNLYVVQKILDDGKKIVKLNTDDWRLPAIKTYLNAGFEPVYYKPDMVERWDQIMEKFK